MRPPSSPTGAVPTQTRPLRSASVELGLRGKIALVTGGSHGLGRATATTLAAEGARVVIVARGAHRLAAAADAIRAAAPGAEVATIVADVAETASAPAIVTQTIAAFGGLDILVNNAGVGAAAAFEVIDDD